MSSSCTDMGITETHVPFVVGFAPLYPCTSGTQHEASSLPAVRHCLASLAKPRGRGRHHAQEPSLADRRGARCETAPFTILTVKCDWRSSISQQHHSYSAGFTPPIIRWEVEEGFKVCCTSHLRPPVLQQHIGSGCSIHSCGPNRCFVYMQVSGYRQ